MTVHTSELEKRERCLAHHLGQVVNDRAFAESAIRDLFDFLQCPLEQVCAEDMYAYADTLRSKKPTEDEWKRRFAALGAFFDSSESTGGVTRNPMKPLTRGVPRCLGNTSEQATGEVVLSSRGMMVPQLAENVPERGFASGATLRALYFPYARSFNSLFLKTSLLVFDELWFLDPLDRITRSEICHYRKDGLVELPEWARVIEVYDQLYDAGFVRIHNDFGLYRSYDGLLSHALEADRHDPEFIAKVSSELDMNGWSIHRARIPVDQQDLSLAGRWAGQPATSGPDWYRSPAGDSERGYGTYQDFSSPYVMNIAHGVVHPVVGFSATLNQTLLTCGLRDIVPVTDSRTALNLLSIKYRRALTMTGTPTGGEAHPAEYDSGTGQLAMAIIDAVVPKEELGRRSFEDLLRYRREARERMRAFQILLRELRAEIEASPWSARFQSELRRTVDAKVRPAEVKLRGELKSTYEKMFGEIVGAAVKAVTPTAVLSVLPGLGLAEALLWGATVGTGLAAISVQPVLDAWAQSRALKRNGLAWLLDVREDA